MQDYAFSPLYPLMIRAGLYLGVASWASGFIITNLASFVFPLIVNKIYGFKIALLTELFPTYLAFGLVPYPDVLTLMLVALAIYFLYLKNKPLLASLCISVGILNAYAIALVVPSFVLMIRSKTKQDLVKFFLPIVATGFLICVWFTISAGSPWMFFDAQRSGWGSYLQDPRNQFLFS
jgi:uncharacterized membrane protein